VDGFEELLSKLRESHQLQVSELQEELRTLRSSSWQADLPPDASTTIGTQAFVPGERSTTLAIGSDLHEDELNGKDALSIITRSPSGKRRTVLDLMRRTTSTPTNDEEVKEEFVLKAAWQEYVPMNHEGSNLNLIVNAMKNSRSCQPSSPTFTEKLKLAGQSQLVAIQAAWREDDRKLLLRLLMRAAKRTMSPSVISPSGNFRMFWDLAGLVLILYDTVAIPLGAFGYEQIRGVNVFYETMDWTTLVFWTLDMFQSFCTGYFSEGQQVMQLRKIWMHYIQTWFFIDILVIGPEWVMMVTGDDLGMKGIGIGRILRIGRAMRVLRLLRLLKLRKLVDAFLEAVESEYTFTMINLVKLLFAMVLINHVIACVWYMLGDTSLAAGDRSWLDEHDTSDLTYMYFTSLHWSLTQFTPASMDVVATNSIERFFSIVVLFFAMVAFSSIVGHITASMTHLQNLKGAQMKEFWLLRKYLKQNDINKELTTRIIKFLEY